MGGLLAGAENDLVLAYVDEELRGIARGIYFEPAEAFAYPMMVYSNVSDGEIMSFKYYDAEKNQLYPCEGTLTFHKDMIEANAYESFQLHVNNSSLGTEDIFGVNAMSLEVYPNPFEDQLHIEYRLAKQFSVRVEIFDLLGNVIEILEERVLESGIYSTKWNPSSHVEGTYILKLTTESTTIMKKIVLIR